MRRKNATLDNKQQNASLSSRIELESMRANDVKLHKETSTASTQSSSSRVALSALNIVTRTTDSLTLADSDNAKAIVSLFTVKKAVKKAKA